MTNSIQFYRVLLTLIVLLSTSSLSAQSRKFKKIQKYMDLATQEGLAGVVVYIKDPKWGKWIGVSGFEKIESKTPMKPNNIFSLASIGKIYNAVAVMKLTEEDRLQLDDKISKYLPTDIIENLPSGQEVTIRHLLNHTSGFINYEKDPELNRLYLSGRLSLDTLSKLKVLERYVFKKQCLSYPGKEYHYSSTNFLLLAMIMDTVVPGGHTNYLRQSILQQNGFLNSFYRMTPPERGVDYYGDIDQNEVLENLTHQTIETTNWFEGDDGIYAPIEEAAFFLESLVNGKLLNNKSLKEMMTWNDPRKPDYGLGLMADKSFPYKFLMGHSGRGIGVTTDLYYFPVQNRIIAIFCNTGVRASSEAIKKTYFKMRTRMVKKLFLF